MGNFEQIGDLIQLEQSQTPYDRVRREHLRKLSDLTGRNVIAYYSGWLQKPQFAQYALVTDVDVQGFMGACNGLQHRDALDLILHTPGGQVSATQALVTYLRKMFPDIRVIVPQLAMSAGTMIACASHRILMGKQSSLGPIDPQLRGMPAHGVIVEFQRAFDEIAADTTPNQAKRALWQPILAQYPPTFVGECQNAIDLAEDLVTSWLRDGMFQGQSDAQAKAESVVRQIGSHIDTKQHDRHLSAEECASFGLVIERLEDDQAIQDAVLSVHHACMHTLGATSALKIIENHNGAVFSVQAGAPR